MKTSHWTRQERFMIVWLKVLAIAFGGLTLLFALHPIYLLEYCNNFGRVFFDFPSPPLADPRYEIWWILAVSALVGETFLAFQAAIDWFRNHQNVVTLLLMKGTAAIGFLLALLFQGTHFFYIIGSMVDGFLFFTTWYFYAKALKSRNFAKEAF